jgi:hypothetical protein
LTLKPERLGPLAAAALCAALLPSVSMVADTAVDRESARLFQGLAAAVAAAGFDRLVDYDQPGGNGKAKPASFLPNVDLAVIELIALGQIAGVGNVLHDRDAPKGYRVNVDRAARSAHGVQFSRWRQERWDTAAGWPTAAAPGDVLVQPATTAKPYTVAYPASVLKLMVAYSVLRLVDQGKLALDGALAFHAVDGVGCGAAPSNPTGIVPAPVANGLIDTVHGWLDKMISGNVVTYDGDLVIDFGYDPQPCQAAAQVDFAHKTGLTYNAGGDAGIVRVLPGQDGRWYLVAVLASAGYRFGDADWNKSKPNACEGSPYVCYPRAFGRLGGAVDALVKARPPSAR